MAGLPDRHDPCLPFAPALVGEVRRRARPEPRLDRLPGPLPHRVAFTTWAYALSQTSAGRMGATTYLVPPLAILMGWLILDETPPGLALAGGALCLAGVVAARRG